MNKGIGWVGFVLAALAGVMLMYGAHRAYVSGARDAFENPPSWDDSESSVPVTSDDPYWGSRFAPVTIVLFSDYQCPHCKNVEETFALLKAEYGGKKLRIVWKHTPLAHPAARVAHVASQTVYALGGQDAFWKFHQLVFDDNHDLSPENFEKWAGQAGVDKAKFKEAYAAGTFAKQVDKDLALSREVGSRGTPASFINGVLVSGAASIDKFQTVIDQQLRIAEQSLAAGTAPEKLYVTLSLKNKEKKAPAPPPDDNAGAEKPAPTRKDRGKVQENDKAVNRVELGSSVSNGPADALVTIVEFGDFECAYTASAQAQLAEVLKSYEGKVRLVWKHKPMPRHSGAVPAALFAMEAREQKGDQGFWDAHALLLKATADATARAQSGETRPDPPFSEKALLEHARELGLHIDKVRAVASDANPATRELDPTPAAQKHMAQLDADLEAADALDIGGTPQFFINGRRLVGAQPVEQFILVIDDELRKAEALLAKGVTAAGVYAEAMNAAKDPEPPAIKLIDPAPPEAPWKGAKHAKVEFHMFSEFECPYCKQVETTLGQVDRALKDRVRMVWRDKPLDNHKLAPIAANAAREALAQKGNDGFWAFHDELFKVARTPDFSRAGFERVAQAQGLDLPAFKAALDTSAHQKVIDEEVRRSASYEITGTPSFVITYAQKDDKLEGFFLSGALPFSRFKKTINLALSNAGVTAPKKRAVSAPAPSQPAPSPP